MKANSLFLAVLIAAFALPAQAYIGPGPGLTMIGSFFTLVGGILLALAMVFAYPIRLYIKKRRAQKTVATETAEK